MRTGTTVIRPCPLTGFSVQIPVTFTFLIFSIHQPEPDMSGQDAQFKAMPLSSLQGVAEQTLKRMNNLGLSSVYDLMFNFPFRYEDRTRVTGVLECAEINAYEKTSCYMLLTVMSDPDIRGRSVTFRCMDIGGNECRLTFFNLYRKQIESMSRETVLLVFGTAGYNDFTGELQILHPEYVRIDTPQIALSGCLTPVYHLTSGLYQKNLRRFTNDVLNLLCKHPLDELLPPYCNPFGMTLTEAVLMAHNPAPAPDHVQLTPSQLPAVKRIRFEELVAFRLSVLHLKSLQKSNPAQIIPFNEKIHQKFIESLPFKLTGAQNRVFAEIVADIQKEDGMNRLVHGDVGSGKTAVAAMVLLQCAAAGKQAVLLAPTDLLAVQHYESITKLFAGFDFRIMLLTGSLKKREKTSVLQSCADGTADIIVGTHAVFQKGVSYKNLVLAVFDEQHRFGISEREALLHKAPEGKTVHELLMTATPIPRTLQMTYYSDTDLSALNEMPAGRIPVTTAVIEASRYDSVVERLREYCKNGSQVYWICPLVEDNEGQHMISVKGRCKALQEALPEFVTDLVHGQMSASAKNAAMERFLNKETTILVATTVIEVGVNVPDATVIIIENAERLGLAQLHQLRGRVGRGNKASYCILLYSACSANEICKKRLQIMKEVNDGFKIAEADLELRGAGEYFGSNQTGREKFRFADPAEDLPLTALSAETAKVIFENDPECSDALIQRWFPEVESRQFMS